MTVNAEFPEVAYTGNGTTTTYHLPFAMPAYAALVATVDGAGVSSPADYAVAGQSMVFRVAPAAGAKIALRRATPAVQAAAFPTADTVTPKAIEAALDRLTHVANELGARQTRSQEVPIGERAPPVQARAVRLNKVRAWNGVGDEVDIDPADLTVNPGGGDTTPGLTDGHRPVLYRYLATSALTPAAWGTHDMSAYIDQFLADCLAMQVIGDASGCGRVRTDGHHWIGDGSGLDHSPAPLTPYVNGGLFGGTVFVRRDGPWANGPVFAMGSDTALKCFCDYPDTITALNAMTVTVDPSTKAVTISGTPPMDHAPFVVSDHMRDATGATVAGGRNIIACKIDVFGVGAKKLVHMFEADPAVEPWSTIDTGGVRDYSAFDGNTCGGHEITVHGASWDTSITYGRAVVSNKIDIDVGSQYWPAASKIGTDPTNGLYWLCQKAKGVKVWGRATGGYIHGKIRNCECAVEFEAGRAPPRWVADMPHDVGYPFIAVDGDAFASGPDYGKFAAIDIQAGDEECSTGLRIMPDAFLGRCKITLGGPYKNPHDPTQDGAAIDDRTDAAKAGVLIKPSGGVAGWHPGANYNFGNEVYMTTLNSAGRVYQSGDNPIGRAWRFVVGALAAWCEIDESRAAIKMKVVRNSALFFDSVSFSGGVYGGKKVFDLTTDLTSDEITAGLSEDDKCLNALTISPSVGFFGYDKANPADITAICPIPEFDPEGVFFPIAQNPDDDDSGGDDGGGDGGGGDGGTPTLTVVITPASRSKTRSGAGICTTDPFVAVVNGGVAPYTFLWTRSAGSSAISPTAPTNASTAASGTLALGDALSAVFTLTVTDSATDPATATATSFATLVEIS